MAVNGKTRFKVDPDEAVFVTADSLRAQAAAVLTAVGMRPADAAIAADGLVSADLRGVESHGVSNMLPTYVTWIESGHLNPRPDIRVLRDRPSTASWDTDRGLGLALGLRAMDTAVEKAHKTGVGMVSLGNGRHLGMLAYTAMRALQHGMIGMVMTAASPRVLPTFGREAKLGTNPIAFAVPAADEPAFVFDAAMSVIPANKITSAHRIGEDLPGGVVADEEGVPLLQASTPVAGAAIRLLPLGSSYEGGSHKGYGLACVTEILSSLLSDTAHVARLGLNFANHFVTAIDIDGFVDRDSFLASMDDFLIDLKTTKAAQGQNRVLVAGQLEAEYERTRTAQGIPLHRDVVTTLRTLGERLGLAETLEVANPPVA